MNLTVGVISCFDTATCNKRTCITFFNLTNGVVLVEHFPKERVREMDAHGIHRFKHFNIFTI